MTTKRFERDFGGGCSFVLEASIDRDSRECNIEVLRADIPSVVAPATVEALLDFYQGVQQWIADELRVSIAITAPTCGPVPSREIVAMPRSKTWFLRVLPGLGVV